jgi:hypothetical protein
MGSEYSSDRESVTSSNYAFRIKQNRKCCLLFVPDSRYHGIPDNPYYYPADEEEAVRLDALQVVVRKLYGRNVLVPLSEPTQIIDLGTGSGTQFPSGQN